MSKKIRGYFYFILSIIVSIFLIWYLLSRIEFKDLKETLANIYLPGLYLYIIFALTGSVFRAWRYKFLLKPEPIGWGNIFMVTFIRNLFVDLLPARIGSLSYIYILNKRLKFTFEIATSTFLIAVIFDFITLSPILILAIFIVGFSQTVIPVSTLLIIALIFFVIVYLVLLRLEVVTSLLTRILEVLLKSFKLREKEWAETIIRKLNLTVDSLIDIKARKIYWPVFFMSLLIRLAKYGALFFLLHALLVSHGFLLGDLSFAKIILGVTGAELSSALPVKGIAGFGTWESAWALSFKLMGFDPRLAIISGFGLHLITQIFEYSLGILSIIILALPIIKRKKVV
ncbi:MAG: lysylphosphatidylglycerol synthase transmembrane domain-containing protein [Candidatus Aminicenantia bacterium]